MINSFDKEYAFLSNFYSSPFTVDNIDYPTVEHYFQAQKTVNYNERRMVAAETTPGRAKRAGRRIHLRSDWEEVKESVMLDGLRRKFLDPELASWLLSTEDQELIEGTYWHDNEWGNCYRPRCKDIQGKNKLGKLLMQVREELKN